MRFPARCQGVRNPAGIVREAQASGQAEKGRVGLRACAAVTWVGNSRADVIGWGGVGNPPLLHPGVETMPALAVPSPANPTREQRIEALLKELLPQVEATVRRLVERAVDVPEAEEFG